MSGIYDRGTSVFIFNVGEVIGEVLEKHSRKGQKYRCVEIYRKYKRPDGSDARSFSFMASELPNIEPVVRGLQGFLATGMDRRVSRPAGQAELSRAPSYDDDDIPF